MASLQREPSIPQKKSDLHTLRSIKKAQDSGQRVSGQVIPVQEPLLRIMVEGKEAQHHLLHIREEFLEKST